MDFTKPEMETKDMLRVRHEKHSVSKIVPSIYGGREYEVIEPVNLAGQKNFLTLPQTAMPERKL